MNRDILEEGGDLDDEEESGTAASSSSSQAAAAPAPPRRCREPHAEDSMYYRRAAGLEIVSMNKGVVTAFLGIVVTDQWKVLDTLGGKNEHFGTLRCMAGHLLHATCTRHARCKLILS